jgi:uncharacterized membrane protein HdeD (DUF308 family)
MMRNPVCNLTGDAKNMQTYMSAPLQLARRYWRMALVRGIVLIVFGLLAIFWPHMTFLLFMRVFGIFAIIEGVLLLTNAFSQRIPARETGTPAQQPDYRRDAGYQRGTDIRQSTDRPGNADTTDYQRNPEYQRNAYQPDDTYDQRSAASRRAENRSNAYPQATADTSAAPPRTNKKTMMAEGVLGIICGLLALILPSIIGALALYAVAAWALFKGIGALSQARTRGWVMGLVGVLGIILALIVLFNPLRIIHSLLVLVGIFAIIIGVLLVARGIHHNTKTAPHTQTPEPTY